MSMDTLAGCIDVVDLKTELPASFITNANIQISYQYNLVNDSYTLTWNIGSRSGGPFGPFPLTMACGTPNLKWENKDFLLFERGCGTFCWYVKIFSILPNEINNVPKYQRIERPLAFDLDRNLIAFYHSQDLIHVKNLINGQKQAMEAVYKCQFHSGLCFTDVKFNNDSLEYTWRENPIGEIISVQLENQLFDN